MSLDVTTPDPPDLTNRTLPAQFDPDELAGTEAELYRGAIEEALREGAWNEAFQEWATYTDVTETEYQDSVTAACSSRWTSTGTHSRNGSVSTFPKPRKG